MDFRYTDTHGRTSGPYSQSALKSLWAKGLLEPDGRIELVTGASGWPVSEISWLAGQSVTDPVAGNPPPPPAPRPPVPPTSSEEARERIAAGTAAVQPSERSRAAYVLLALIPPFIGVFGVHNILAGYTIRGWIALALSMVTLFGIGCVVFPCSCVAIPTWIALFVVSAVEAIIVTTDAAGRPFS